MGHGFMGKYNKIRSANSWKPSFAKLPETLKPKLQNIHPRCCSFSLASCFAKEFMAVSFSCAVSFSSDACTYNQVTHEHPTSQPWLSEDVQFTSGHISAAFHFGGDCSARHGHNLAQLPASLDFSCTHAFRQQPKPQNEVKDRTPGEL